MTAAQTLLKVRRCDVTLVPSGHRLRFHPASALSSELVEELREHKESILEILARQEVAAARGGVPSRVAARARVPVRLRSPGTASVAVVTRACRRRLSAA